MKKILLITIIAVSIFSCKKDDTSTPAATTSTTSNVTPTTTTTQDSHLLGIWIEDSLSYTGGYPPVIYDSIGRGAMRVYDTIYIKANSFTEIAWQAMSASNPTLQQVLDYSAFLSYSMTDTWETASDSISITWNYTPPETNWYSYYYSITGSKLQVIPKYFYSDNNGTISHGNNQTAGTTYWYHKL